MSYQRSAEIAERAAYSFGLGTIGAGFTLNDIAIIVGIVATITTVGLTWYYKQKHLDLARRRFEKETEGGSDA